MRLDTGQIVSGGNPPPSHDDFFISGLYYSGMVMGTGSVGTVAMAANTLCAVPFVVAKARRFDRIASVVTSLSAGNMKLAVYRDDGSVYPGALHTGTANLDTGTNGIKEETIDIVLPPALYWLVVWTDATPTIRASSNTSPIMGWDIQANSASTPRYYAASLAFGSLPSTFPAGAAATRAAAPLAALRAA